MKHIKIESKNITPASGLQGGRVAVLIAAMVLQTGLSAQNTSYNANTVGIPGTFNTAFGFFDMLNNTTATQNCATGYQSMDANTTGYDNAGYGYLSLNANTTGEYNVGLGWNAILYNINGSQNTAVGANVFFSNLHGSYNVAQGAGALYSNTGSLNVAIGNNAGAGITSGSDNTSMGHQSLSSNVTGNFNSAIGFQSMYSNTVDSNSAFGYRALYTNNGTFSSGNMAFGYQALTANDSWYHHTAVGHNALANNAGLVLDNTAIGYQALFHNVFNTGGGGQDFGVSNSALGSMALAKSTANYNSGIGYQALYNTTGGVSNTAAGNEVMQTNTSGYFNAAVGEYALVSNISGYENTAIGKTALYSNTTGDNNVANGYFSLDQNTTGQFNVASGALANSSNVTGNNNTCLGNNSLLASNGVFSNATALGNGALVTASNKVRIGDGAVTVVEIATTAIYTGSDGRFKSNVTEQDVKGLDFIRLLRPVAYNFEAKKFTQFQANGMPDSVKTRLTTGNFDAATAIRRSGFIAQEAEKAAQQVGYNFDAIHKPESDNDNYSLAYSQFVVPLVKAAQELDSVNINLKQQADSLRQQVYALLAKVKSSSAAPDAIGANGFSMAQNVPNPFTGQTVINYTLPASMSSAYMALYDITGKQVTTYSLNRGSSSITIGSDSLQNGIYIYSIVVDGKQMDSKRMVVGNQ